MFDLLKILEDLDDYDDVSILDKDRNSKDSIYMCLLHYGRTILYLSESKDILIKHKNKLIERSKREIKSLEESCIFNS